MNSDTLTPRTDILLGSDVAMLHCPQEMIDHARQLERELGQMDKSYQGARSRENDKMDRIKTLERELAEAKAALPKAWREGREVGRKEVMDYVHKFAKAETERQMASFPSPTWPPPKTP